MENSLNEINSLYVTFEYRLNCKKSQLPFSFTLYTSLNSDFFDCLRTILFPWILIIYIHAEWKEWNYKNKLLSFICSENDVHKYNLMDPINLQDFKLEAIGQVERWRTQANK